MTPAAPWRGPQILVTDAEYIVWRHAVALFAVQMARVPPGTYLWHWLRFGSGGPVDERTSVYAVLEVLGCN